RQDVGLDVLGRVFEEDRPALTVGDEVQPYRRIGDAEFFGEHIALEIAALLPAVFLRPGHADPALGTDPTAELGILPFAVPDAARIEGAGRDLRGNEGAHLRAQRLAFGRQADLIETKLGAHAIPAQRDATSGHNSSAPRAAIRLPSATAQ